MHGIDMNRRAKRNRIASPIKEYATEVLNAFYDAYRDSYEMLEAGPDDYGDVYCVLECPDDVLVVCTISMKNGYKCRLDYAFDDIEDIVESDVIRLTDDPKSSARLIHDTIEDYIKSFKQASRRKANSHRLARGFHSKWNESDMYDFVNDVVDDINRKTYSDIMARNLRSYEGDDGEVYTFDIMSDYFTLHVEVDGTNVSISCGDDPSLDQAWDFDEDYSSSNLADDLFSIASDAEEVFIEMYEEEEGSDGFIF